jgi:hypothetical protein
MLHPDVAPNNSPASYEPPRPPNYAQAPFARGRLHDEPLCSCGSPPRRAIRVRTLLGLRGDVSFLADVWVCNACGSEWVDDALARLNEWAADAVAAED